jgi:hypothetical protein
MRLAANCTVSSMIEDAAMETLHFHFDIDGDNFTSAGDASVQVKKKLRQILTQFFNYSFLFLILKINLEIQGSEIINTIAIISATTTCSNVINIRIHAMGTR